MSSSDQTNLLKLPREQLKQLCKERGHTGYSKCTKPQLVALLGSDTPSKFKPSMMTTAPPSKQVVSSSTPVSKKRLESGSSGIGETVAKRQKCLNTTPPSSSHSTNPPMTSVPSKAKRKPRFAQRLPVLRDLLVLPTSTTPATVPLPAKQLALPPMSRLLPQSSIHHPISLPQPPEPSGQLQTTPNLQPHTRVLEKQESGTSLPATNSSQRPSGGNGRTQLSKKFLDPRNGVTSGNLAPCGPHDTLRSTILPSSSTASVEQLPTPYLDFTVLPIPVLGLIGIPPSISDRKKVHLWSVILSGISNTERRACILVSRMFRYAVYLSASVILFSKFPGKRLDDVTRTYSPSTFNFWPYLRVRETELAEQRSRYLRSFLHRFYETFEPIDQRLWISPDNPKQYAVAVRFVMSKAWFAISKCPSPSDTTPWLHSVVMSAREVVPDEIWEVATMTVAQGPTAARNETFYVLESTCEVIGRPPNKPACLPETIQHIQHSLPIRVDWSEYVADCIISSAEAPGKKLFDRIQWAHYEEYQNGISRHWLTRTQGDGEVGKLKRRVAEKYVLASVAENSVSGSWRSVQEMANESFVPTEPNNSNRRLKMNMKMFLSAHHHVESVHFQTPGKKAFHPAVAAVQTSAREYYILRDNGMLIGTEEDGVNPLWQVLLDCDEKGLPCDSSALLSITH